MKRFTIYGTLDGMTVGELIDMLQQYPDDGIISAGTEYGPEGHEIEYFEVHNSNSNLDYYRIKNDH